MARRIDVAATVVDEQTLIQGVAKSCREGLWSRGHALGNAIR